MQCSALRTDRTADRSTRQPGMWLQGLSAHSLIPLQCRERTARPRLIRIPRRSLQHARRVANRDCVLRHILQHRSLIAARRQTSFHTHTFVTTLPAPIVLPRPIVTPGKMIAFPPIQQSSPITIGPPISGPAVPFRTSGSRGCVPE